ncbi:CBS domain-containing protein [Marinobacterium rhizophilum]|uniref:CBS domain-containing protein n=1 Tax=Marinobacterium rhizophilum TaxID=420402 RepID=A0ABY5HIV8_9GAMM|nr:CBS domain-containing protein [Marinobacterium rhizophilum]UTW11538.1 CBS domain-containing protein [Marinobacterium rhizophilum]
MRTFRELKTLSLRDYSRLSSPGHESLSLESPASSIVTSFESTRPLALELDVGIHEALLMMKKAHVRSVLVMDSAEKFRGIISVSDLESRKVLSIAQSLGLRRDDLSIGDVMTPSSKLAGLSMQQLNGSSIGDILKTLQDVGSQHMLVVRPEDQQICGIISASDIARKLHIPVAITERATSFREIVAVLYGHSAA